MNPRTLDSRVSPGAIHPHPHPRPVKMPRSPGGAVAVVPGSVLPAYPDSPEAHFSPGPFLTPLFLASLSKCVWCTTASPCIPHVVLVRLCVCVFACVRVCVCCVHVSHVWCKGRQQAGGGREETGRLTSGETEEHRGGNLPGALDLGGSLQDTRRAKGFLRITHEP